MTRGGRKQRSRDFKSRKEDRGTAVAKTGSQGNEVPREVSVLKPISGSKLIASEISDLGSLFRQYEDVGP